VRLIFDEPGVDNLSAQTWSILNAKSMRKYEVGLHNTLSPTSGHVEGLLRWSTACIRTEFRGFGNGASEERQRVVGNVGLA
jgi:hypothetical protein